MVAHLHKWSRLSAQTSVLVGNEEGCGMLAGARSVIVTGSPAQMTNECLLAAADAGEKAERIHKYLFASTITSIIYQVMFFSTEM